MSYSLEKIASLIGAHCFGEGEAQIDWILNDSRSLAFPESTLFLRCAHSVTMAISIFPICIAVAYGILWWPICLKIMSRNIPMPIS